jgi:uncharacterized caspase-like protein
MLRVFALFALLLGCSLLPAAADAEKRVALVIGNAAYVAANPLTNPANDAGDMAAALTKLGFDVVLGLDLDKAGFDAKVREFARALDGAATGLLFYAGHGLQVAGQNYLVPIDAKLEGERDLDFEAVRLDFILKQMELGRQDKTNIVFLDACRDNPLARNLARSMGTRSASIGQGLAQVQTGVGTFISYSTQPGNVAADGKGRNSPFTSALARHMLTEGRNLTAIMIDVRKDVIAATGGQQVPWDHSALTADFYFAAVGPGVRPGAAPNRELEERVMKLEDELKHKSEVASVASSAVLAQLKQRLRQLDDDNRRDQQQIFDVMRQGSGELDPQKKMRNTQEIGRLQVQMVKRGKDRRELLSEIENVEKELGLPADGSAAGPDTNSAKNSD